MLAQKDVVISCRMNALAAMSKLKQWEPLVAECALAMDEMKRLHVEAKFNDEQVAAQTLARAHYFRGFAYFKLWALAAADSDFRKALELAPDDESIREDWKQVQAAIQTETTVKELLLASMKYLQTNNTATAIECCLNALRECQVLQKDELTGVVHGNLAATYVKVNDDVKATEHYKRALMFAAGQKNVTTAHHERKFDLLEGLSACYARRKDFSSAHSVIQDAIRTFPQCPGRQEKEAMLYFNAARVCCALSKTIDAQEAFLKSKQAAIKSKQTEVALNSMFWLTKAYVESSHHREAMAVVQEAISMAHEAANVDMYEKFVLAVLDLVDLEARMDGPVDSDLVDQLFQHLEYFERKKHHTRGHLRASEVLANVLQRSTSANELDHDKLDRVLQIVDNLNISNLVRGDDSILMKLVLLKVDVLILRSDRSAAKSLLRQTLTNLNDKSTDHHTQKLRRVALHRLVEVCNIDDQDSDCEDAETYWTEAASVLRNDPENRSFQVALCRLLSKVARGKAKIGALEEALTLMEEVLRVTRRVYPVQSEQECEALVGLCVLEIRRGHHMRARELMTEIEMFPTTDSRQDVKCIKDQLRMVELKHEQLEQKQHLLKKQTSRDSKVFMRPGSIHVMWRGEWWIAMSVGVAILCVVAVFVL